MEAQILKMANEAKDTAHSAKAIAVEANQKIDSYIKVNTIQFEGIIDKMGGLTKSVELLISRAWLVAGTIIVLLLGALGALTMMLLSKT